LNPHPAPRAALANLKNVKPNRSRLRATFSQSFLLSGAGTTLQEPFTTHGRTSVVVPFLVDQLPRASPGCVRTAGRIVRLGESSVKMPRLANVQAVIPKRTQNVDEDFHSIGATGFEPAAFWSQRVTDNSLQVTKLHHKRRYVKDIRRFQPRTVAVRFVSDCDRLRLKSGHQAGHMPPLEFSSATGLPTDA
jgi:hypothetical protein